MGEVWGLCTNICFYYRRDWSVFQGGNGWPEKGENENSQSSEEERLRRRGGGDGRSAGCGSGEEDSSKGSAFWKALVCS